jgi:hypothetical protein
MAGKIQSPDESIVNWVRAELEARGATNDMIMFALRKKSIKKADDCIAIYWWELFPIMWKRQ